MKKIMFAKSLLSALVLPLFLLAGLHPSTAQEAGAVDNGRSAAQLNDTLSLDGTQKLRLVAQNLPWGLQVDDNNGIDFSPDDKYFVTTGSIARVWEFPSCKVVREFYGHGFGFSGSNVYTAKFSPDGKFILSGGADHIACLWNVQTGEEIRRFQGYDGSILDATFSADGKLMATASGNIVQLWNIATGEEIRRFEGKTNEIVQVLLPPSGKYLVSASEDGLIRKWDLSTGQELLRLDCQGWPKTISCSPDDRYIYSVNGTWYSSRKAPLRGYSMLWDFNTGQIIQEFKPNAPYSSGLNHRVSDDWKSIIFFLPRENPGNRIVETKFIFWDIKTRAESHVVTLPFIGENYDVMWINSTHGMLVLRGKQLWDLNSQKVIATMGAQTASWGGSYIQDLQFDDNRENLWIGSHLWDLSLGKEIKNLTPLFQGDKLSPSGKFLCRAEMVKSGNELNSSYKREFTVADLIQKTPPVPMQGMMEFCTDKSKAYTIFSKDERFLIAYSDEESELRLWDVQSGQPVLTFEGKVKLQLWMPDRPSYLDCSGDGKYLLAIGTKGWVYKWDIATGKLLWSIQHGSQANNLVVSHNSNFFLIQAWSEKAGTYKQLICETATGKVLREGLSSRYDLLTLSPDDKYFLTTSNDQKVRLWSLESGKEISIFQANAGKILSMSFSPDGRFIIIKGEDDWVRFWQTSTGKPLCALSRFDDGSWAVVDPQGRYDASNAGDTAGLHWVMGMTPIDLNQFKDGFYEPGLLAKELGFNKEPMRAVPTLADLKLFPEVTLSPPADGKATITLKAHDGGIGPVQVWINGKEWKEDARPAGFNAQSPTLDLSLPLNSQLIKPGEENVLRVVARNAQSTLASPPMEVRWTAPGAPEPFAPRLYAIVCGISQYADPRKIKTLRFAAKDARDMALALAAGSKELFGTDKTEIHLLTGEGKTNKDATAATKANLKAAFEDVAKKARPQDVLVVYLAGHGTTLGLGTSVYCYPTQDADNTDFGTAAAAGKMVTDSELAEWTKAIPAQKQVLILDTCASGAAGEKLTEKRAVPGDQTRAIERLKDRTGFHVLMGCAADSRSYEATRFNQGLLTYALLEGMKGPTRAAGKGVIQVGAWFRYAQEQVPKLAGAVGGIQRPEIKEPSQNDKAEDFPIAQLDDQAAQAVPLSPVGILVMEPRIVDENAEDALGLEAALTSSLQAAGLGQLNVAGQKMDGLVYVPVDDLPGAWRIGGSYRVQGEQVILELTFRDGKLGAGGEVQMFKKTLTGRKADINGLAATAVAVLRNFALGLTPAGAEANLRSSGKSSKTRTAKTKWSGKRGRGLTSPPAADDYFSDTPLPTVGEIALAGEVVAVDEAQRQLTISVRAFRLSSGNVRVLDTSKAKLVILPDGANLDDWQSGDEIVALGPDSGSGLKKILHAREVF
jgi:WD40 repeat protein